jgi:hypothetical protein
MNWYVMYPPIANTLGKRIGNYNIDLKTKQEKTIFAGHSSNVSHSFYNNIFNMLITSGVS